MGSGVCPSCCPPPTTARCHPQQSLGFPFPSPCLFGDLTGRRHTPGAVGTASCPTRAPAPLHPSPKPLREKPGKEEAKTPKPNRKGAATAPDSGADNNLVLPDSPHMAKSSDQQSLHKQLGLCLATASSGPGLCTAASEATVSPAWPARCRWHSRSPVTTARSPPCQGG